MRVAEICPVCATYINAACIVYNGDYLSSIDVPPLMTLDEALQQINDTFIALSGEGEPSTIPAFVGQLYIDTDQAELWIGMGTDSINWGLLSDISTTTTTSTTSA